MDERKDGQEDKDLGGMKQTGLLLLVAGFCLQFAGSGLAFFGKFGILIGGLILFARSRKKKRLAERAAEEVMAVKEAPKEIDLAEAFAGEEAELAKELYDKAYEDYEEIEHVRASLRDPRLAAQLLKMQQIAYKIMAYLADHPTAIPDARRFIDTYQGRAARFSKKFLEMEQTGVDSQQLAQTKEKIITTLSSFDEAYLAEFDRIIHTKLLDVDAELDVLNETMRADGIENKKETTAETADSMYKAATPAPAPTEPPVNRGGRKVGPDMANAIFSQGGGIPEEMLAKVRKEKIVDGLLAICLGTFGVHKFYQGKTTAGVLYALFCWTGLPTIIGFVEGLRYLVMPMKDYYEQYMR